ncbi:ATP-grasp domain-containing protein [Actinomadura cremea]|nr:ATP-grasp domain-containing protein [Actinomadura cremea]
MNGKPADARGARGARPDLDPGLPVLLLRTDHNHFHHGTLGAIRSLGRAGVRVHAILESRRSPVARSRYLHRGHPWAPPAQRPAALLGHLRMIGERIPDGPALLLPTDDAGAIFAAEYADALAPRFVVPPQDPDVPRRVADKARLLAACEEHDLTAPQARVPATPGDVDDAVKTLDLPLIAKWARPWLLPRGLRSTTLVHDAAEVHRLFATVPDHDAGPLVLQRRIPPDGGDWFFQGYFNSARECLYGGVGRKHLAHPPQAGHTVVGEWVDNPLLHELAVRIVTLLGCRGLVDLDFRRDPATGDYHLLDVNPRIGAQFRLFTDARGLDLARVLHLDQSGRAVPPARPAIGRTLLVENHYLRQAPRTGALRPLRAADELAWYAGDDLRPLLAMGRQSALRAAERLRAARRDRPSRL